MFRTQRTPQPVGRRSRPAALLSLVLVLALSLGTSGVAFAGKPSGGTTATKALAVQAPYSGSQLVDKAWVPALKIGVTSDGKVNTRDNKTKITLVLLDNSTPAPQGTLSGTLTKTVVNGVATFDNLVYNKVENIQVKATASDTSVAPAILTVQVVRKSLAFGTQPASPVTVGTAWPSFKVHILRNGALDTTDNVTSVTIAQAPNVTMGLLSGTLTRKAVQGVVTFDDIAYSLPGTIALEAFVSGDTTITAARSGDVVVQEALSVLGAAPAGGTYGAAINTPVSVKFSAPIDLASVTPNSFRTQRQDGAYLAGTYSLADGDTVVVFTPSELHFTSTSYYVTVGTGIRDIYGHSLPAPYSWSFRTQDPRWGAPNMLTWAATTMSPDVALNADGNGWAVWTQRNTSTGRYEVYGAPYRNDVWNSSGWGYSGKIVESPYTCYNPLVAASGGDNAVLVYVGFVDQYYRYQVYASVHTPTGWGPPMQLSSHTFNTSNYGHQVAANRAGHTVAAWLEDGTLPDNTTRTYRVVANRYTPGPTYGWWSGIQNVYNVGDRLYPAPAVAIAENGTAAVAYRTSTGLHLAWNAIPYTYWTQLQIDTLADNTLPAVRLDRNGTAFVVWTSSQDGQAHAARVSLTSGQVVHDLLSAGAFSTATPQVAVDPAGNALAVWAQFDNVMRTYALWNSRMDVATGAWSTAMPVGYGGVDNQSSPRVAFDEKGNATLAYLRSGYGVSNVYTTRMPAISRTWEPPVLLNGSPAYNSTDLRLATDGKANAAIVFRELNTNTGTGAYNVMGVHYQGPNPLAP